MNGLVRLPHILGARDDPEARGVAGVFLNGAVQHFETVQTRRGRARHRRETAICLRDALCRGGGRRGLLSGYAGIVGIEVRLRLPERVRVREDVADVRHATFPA